MTARTVLLFLSLPLLGLTSGAGHAEVPLPALPDWESTPNNQYGTGLGVGDLDRDGWVDLVVANGNDMARQKLAVYRNLGSGVFPLTPSWSSTDLDYNGHLDLADVDGDGFLDCAVAVYIGAGGFSTPGRVKLYKGNGDGTFSSSPIWQSSDSFYCFSLAFGDMDLDGHPDLACATGDDYENHPEHRRIYRNTGSALETTPSWVSTEIECSLDVVWADLNKDGWLDLAFAGTSCPNRIYFSQGGAIQTSAGWTSSDASIYANTVAAGDVNGDGWMDLAIADNFQLGGSGRFKLYTNPGAPSAATTPVWQSNQAGYGSHVSLVDIDEDGDLDLSTGMWWGPVRVYENGGGILGADPAYTSSTSSVIENEVWEDVDNDGLQRGVGAEYHSLAGQRLFVLPQKPARKILSLAVNGVAIAPASATLDSDDGWFVLPTAPATPAEIYVTFMTSADLDLALSNWDTSEGEYLFLNTRRPADAPSAAGGMLALRAGPNPSDGAVRVWFEDGTAGEGAQIEVLDPAGRKLRTFAGTGGEVLWDGADRSGRSVPAGVYWIRLVRSGEQVSTVKVIRR